MNITSNLQRTRLIQRRRKTNDTTVYISLQKNLWKQVPPNSTQHDGSYKVIISVTGVSLFRHRVQMRPVGDRALTSANEWGGRGRRRKGTEECWGGALSSLPFSLHQAPLGALTQVTGLWETLWEPSSLPHPSAPPPPPSPKIWRTLLTSSLFVRWVPDLWFSPYLH